MNVKDVSNDNAFPQGQCDLVDWLSEVFASLCGFVSLMDIACTVKWNFKPLFTRKKNVMKVNLQKSSKYSPDGLELASSNFIV
ncbi:hypothetical protein RRG08_050614 [Elysia crispata]|uniref:Uncharacterized protein n=1 Tax=Elysia crispata TaxID=231223 RepID=A0AAE1AQW2_9GAST|nr:hypothetical protein RRG08_050614 [Elysia crispata]